MATPRRRLPGIRPIEPDTLGTHTKLPSGVAPQRVTDAKKAEQRRIDQRRARYQLRNVVRDVSRIPRLARCGRRPIDSTLPPAVLVRSYPGGDVAHYSGLQLCGSAWSCPVCAPRIRQERALELDAAGVTWIDRHGAGAVKLLTLTMPHDYGEALRDLLATIRGGFAALVSGRAWQTLKADYGLAHYVVAHDVTHGVNGWHPHLHIVLFGTRAFDVAELAALERAIWQRWSRTVAERGHRLPTREHGVKLEQARRRADVARYVCQVVTGDVAADRRAWSVAHEVARGDLKTAHAGHQSPWQILEAIAARPRADRDGVPDQARADLLELWHEWERTTRGVKAIRWSRGLRAAVALGEELTDEQLVAIEVGGDVRYRFTHESWVAVTGSKTAAARILEFAERGRFDELRDFVRRCTDRWLDRLRRRLKRPPPEELGLGPVEFPLGDAWYALDDCDVAIAREKVATSQPSIEARRAAERRWWKGPDPPQ